MITNLEPIREIPGDEAKQPRPGIALCLSGGGYRAMVFHLGALWRLNEVGLLKKLDRISSVSGGSITAGMLGLQ
jgi:NTE family protein